MKETYKASQKSHVTGIVQETYDASQETKVTGHQHSTVTGDVVEEYGTQKTHVKGAVIENYDSGQTLTIAAAATVLVGVPTDAGIRLGSPNSVALGFELATDGAATAPESMGAKEPPDDDRNAQDP